MYLLFKSNLSYLLEKINLMEVDYGHWKKNNLKILTLFILISEFWA